MMVSRAKVLANPKKIAAMKAKKEVEKFLAEMGVSTKGNPQLVITIGGDGTVLYHKKYYGIPFFAIGSRTSFLCQADFSDWKGKLSRAIRSLKCEKRLMLCCKVGKKRMPLALNEIGVRSPSPRVLSIYVQIGKKHCAFRADGMLFCTPTGSGAYCYSCYGKKMAKQSESYQLVAISPFMRAFKPTIVPKSTKCRLRLGKGNSAILFIDGQFSFRFRQGGMLEVEACRKPFLFAKA